MKELEIQLVADNGKALNKVKIKYFLFQPRLIQIDEKYYVQISESIYQHSYPQQYKTKA